MRTLKDIASTVVGSLQAQIDEEFGAFRIGGDAGEI
jgi:hypothetical protein